MEMGFYDINCVVVFQGKNRCSVFFFAMNTKRRFIYFSVLSVWHHWTPSATSWTVLPICILVCFKDWLFYSPAVPYSELSH